MYSCLLNKDVWSRTEELDSKFHHRDFLKRLLSLDSASFDSITTEASDFRNGVKCRVDLSIISSGSYNLACPIIFDDGVYWLLRFCALHDYSTMDVMEHSIATMRYLKDKNARIPIPEVYFYALNGRNPLGVPYMAMEFIDGVPTPYADRFDPLKPFPFRKVYDQICRIANEFSNLRFEEIGALHLERSFDTFSIGAMFDWRGNRHGPFRKAKQYYTAITNAYWHGVRNYLNVSLLRGLPESWCWETARDADKRLFTGYLYRQCLSLVQWDKVYDKFCLQHQDFKLRNFLVDENYKVVGLIDWDWVSTVPLHGYDPLSFCQFKRDEKIASELFPKWEWLDGSYMPLVSEMYKSREGTLCRLLGTSLLGNPTLFAPQLFECYYSMAWEDSELQRRVCMSEALKLAHNQMGV
jgi:hypothetical protein